MSTWPHAVRHVRRTYTQYRESPDSAVNVKSGCEIRSRSTRPAAGWNRSDRRPRDFSVPFPPTKGPRLVSARILVIAWNDRREIVMKKRSVGSRLPVSVIVTRAWRNNLIEKKNACTWYCFINELQERGGSCLVLYISCECETFVKFGRENLSELFGWQTWRNFRETSFEVFQCGQWSFEHKFIGF